MSDDPNAVATLETPAEPSQQVETQLPADDGTGAPPASAQDADAKPQKPRLPAGVVKELAELREDRRFLREQLAAKTQEPEKPADIPPTRPKPVLETFEGTTEQFYEELTNWTIEQREAARERKAQEATQQAEHQKVTDSFNAQIAAAREKHPDYEDAFAEAQAAGLQLSNAMLVTLMDSEVGGEMAYHLLKNPDELKRIAAIKNPWSAARELGKIEARIAGDNPAKDEKEPPPLTKAPKPPTPIKGSSPGSKPFDPTDPSTWTDFADFEKKMAQREAKRPS